MNDDAVPPSPYVVDLFPTQVRLPAHLRRRAAAVMAAQPPEPPCKCRHRRSDHGTDRNNRPICFGGAVCGCATYRPQETK